MVFFVFSFSLTNSPCWLNSCFWQTLTWLLSGILHQTHRTPGSQRAPCWCSLVHGVHRQSDGASPKLRCAGSPPWLHTGQRPLPCGCGWPRQDMRYGQQSMGDQGMLGLAVTVSPWKDGHWPPLSHISNTGDSLVSHFEDGRIAVVQFLRTAESLLTPFLGLQNQCCPILRAAESLYAPF